MDIKTLIKKLKKHDETALEKIIQIYTPYISTIIYNVSRGGMGKEDIEEVCADVFVTLWKNADKIKVETLKGYISVIAKNKARDKLRMQGNAETNDIEDLELIDEYSLEDNITNKALSTELLSCVNKLGEPDSEIVIRYYYYYQTSKKIAEVLDMNIETIKTKLKRAKVKLRKLLEERGYS